MREGWDNPNVFQICVLREMASEQQRRQTIGRGLRLCVNQNGDRLRGFEVNTLTVIATESYEQFAEELQKEIEKDTGIRFGIVEPHQFSGIGIGIAGADGKSASLGFKQSQELWEHLKSTGLVNGQGKIQDALRKQLKDGTLTVPAAFGPLLPQVQEILRKLAGRLEIKNADERHPVKTRQAILHGPEFKALWDRIKHKTTYRVQFDNEKLLRSCIDAITAPTFVVTKTRLQWRKADLSIGRAGVDAKETVTSAPVTIDEGDLELPDILTDLQDKTQLTRRSIYRILVDSGRLDDFKRNPQQFIELATEAINRAKRMALVDGIKYERIGSECYSVQELFEAKELEGYLKSMVAVNRGVHDHVIFQSDTEREFAEKLDKNEAVKVFAKLPAGFKVPTPLGFYNPDWAVLIEKDGAERLYFVVETKGVISGNRPTEEGKMKCGAAHFQALSLQEQSVQYVVAQDLDGVMARAFQSQ